MPAIVTNAIRKGAKGRPDIISMVIRAVSPGSCNFTLPRESQVHSLPITGGRDPTKRKFDAYTVKLR